MIQEGYEYVEGSAARQLSYDVYEQNSVLKAKKQYKNNRKTKLKLVLSVLAVLFAALAVMYRFALITQLSYNINQNEITYNDLRNKNSLLKVQIEAQTDLTEIKEIAETRLGMQKPDKSQVVYIKVPRNDYTVVMTPRNGTPGSGDGVLKAIAYRVSGLVKLFE